MSAVQREAGSAAERETRALPRLGRDPRVLGWAFGHGVSEAGDQILSVALVFTAVQLAGPAVAGVVVACSVLPKAALTLFGGAVVDRTDARRVMLGSDLAQLLVLLAALAALAAGGESIGLLVALAVGYGIASAFYDPAMFALPRLLRPTEDLTRVAGIRQLALRAATIGGPPLGGLLVAGFGLAGALTADAVTFAVIALVLLVLVRPRFARARADGGSVLADLRDGLAYLWSTARVRDLVLALAGLNVFLVPVISVGLALRSSQQGWGAPALGVLLGSMGAAALAGTLVMVRVRVPRPVLVALLALLGQASAAVVVGFAPFAGVLAATVVIGLTAGVASPLLSGALQATVDEAYLARVGSVTSLADAALIPVSVAGFGLLAGAAGVMVACAVCGGGFILQVLYALSRRQVRQIRLGG